ncbi:uncharacterized protein KRP23_4040 [Phytophthora ramorum]|uniref:uncharacterized protein n=1 Tax=Phytophthora ramorum TaxID=164328 RepID=UPI0030A308BA|nr:hypothetical protein KRP23_4040 [Phytophthora ramorum]
MSGHGDADELPGGGSGAPIDEIHALTIHTVAKVTVDAVVREAVDELAQAVAGATQWLTQAVRGELISQAVAAAEPPGSPEEESSESPASTTMLPALVENLPLPNRPSSTVVHAVAKAAVDAATGEAVKEVVQAVEKATQWFTQAVGNELVSDAMDVAVHKVTERITLVARSELVAHALDDATPPSDTSTASPSEERQELDGTAEVATAHEVRRMSSSSIDDVRDLAKATTEAAVHKALQNVAQTISGASEWFAQAVRAEIPAQTVDEGSPEVPPADEVDNNSTDSEETLPAVEAVFEPVHVPPIQLPNSSSTSPETLVEYHEFAVPFVNEVVSSALHQVAPANSIEPEDDGYEDYTPINTPTGEEASPLPSARAPEQESLSEPPVIPSGRATPPDSKPTTRRSPITSKRGLGTPTSRGNSPASAPPAISTSPLADEPPADFSEPEPPHPMLPPLVLPVIQGAQLSSRTKHQHKTPRKTPRQASYPSFREDRSLNDSPRASTSSSQLNKHSVSAELEVTPMSSARAAASIYVQQPSSSRRHHHKPKKLRDTASQTSPPPSPPASTLAQQPLLEDRVDSYGTELPKTQIAHVKLSPREVPSPENSARKKADGSNNTLLAPLSKTPAGVDTVKSPSPPRPHTKHSHKGGGGGPSPNKRSGYCQRCAFEGRSCKINDCLKHQVLK